MSQTTSFPHIGDCIQSWEHLTHGFTGKHGEGALRSGGSNNGKAHGYVIFKWNSKGTRLVVDQESWKHGFCCSTQSAHSECVRRCEELILSGHRNPFWIGYSLNAVEDARPGHRKESRKLVACLITPKVSDSTKYSSPGGLSVGTVTTVCTEGDQFPYTPDNDLLYSRQSSSTSQANGTVFKPNSRSTKGETGLSQNSLSQLPIGNTNALLPLSQHEMFIRSQTKTFKNRIGAMIFKNASVYLELEGLDKFRDPSYIDLLHNACDKPKTHLHFGGNHYEKTGAVRLSSSYGNGVRQSSLLDDLSEATENMEKKRQRSSAIQQAEAERARRVSHMEEAERSSRVSRNMHKFHANKLAWEEWGRRVLKEKNEPRPERKSRNDYIKKILATPEATAKFEKMHRFWNQQHAKQSKDFEAQQIEQKIKLIDKNEAIMQKEREQLIHEIYNAEQARRSNHNDTMALEDEYRRCSLAKAVSHGIHYELSEVSHIVDRSSNRNHALEKVEQERARKLSHGEVLPPVEHIRKMTRVKGELKKRIRLTL